MNGMEDDGERHTAPRGHAFSSNDPPHFFHNINQHMMFIIARKARLNQCSDLREGYKSLSREILDKSGLEDVVLNDRIVMCFKTKILLLLQKGRKAKGGAQMARLESELQRKTYKIKIFISETSNIKLVNRNARTVREKLMAEKELNETEVKRKKLSHEMEKAKKQTVYWKGRFKSMVQKVMKLEQKSKSFWERKQKEKSYSDYSERSKFRIRNKLKDECQCALDFLGMNDLIPCKVDYFDPSTGAYDSIHLFDKHLMNEMSPSSENEDDLDNVHLLLYVKEKFQISNKAWHELSSIAAKLPSTYCLKKRIKALNKNWDIFPTPGESVGVQIKLEQSLKLQLNRLLNEGTIRATDTVKIKISGDGTNIGKRFKLLNVTYTIINEGQIAATEKGNYALAIVKTKDDYDGLTKSLYDLKTEMVMLKSVTVGNNTFLLEFFLGGDWKFLATICGIGPANQDHACIWCRCPRLMRSDTSKQWPLVDPHSGSRTIETIKRHSKAKKYNCRHSPFFDFIEMDHVIIDTLHLFLRICDILIENLIRQLKLADSIEKITAFSSGFDVGKHKHMEAYEKLLNSLGIPFSWHVSKESKKLCYRDLNGPEKLTLLQSINIQDLLPRFQHSSKLQSLWKDFLNLYGEIRNEFDDERES